jgi:hypothetical protein
MKILIFFVLLISVIIYFIRKEKIEETFKININDREIQFKRTKEGVIQIFGNEGKIIIYLCREGLLFRCRYIL